MTLDIKNAFQNTLTTKLNEQLDLTQSVKRHIGLMRSDLNDIVDENPNDVPAYNQAIIPVVKAAEELIAQASQHGFNTIESEFNGKAGYTNLADLDQLITDGFNEWLDTVKQSDVADKVKIPLAINSAKRFEDDLGIQSARELIISGVADNVGQAHEAKSNNQAHQEIADLKQYADMSVTIA